jgi:hypothetical protein
VKTEKKIITVNSANPPTTPMVGFAKGAAAKGAKADVKPQPPVESTPTAKKPAAGENRGALLSRKKK